jgi:gliding motility-associated-like protein
MPFLAGQPSVVFRFIFGAGTICNNYDGFAFDDFLIDDAPANSASFTYSCSAARTVSFTNTSTPCPTVFSWDFGDPGSGTNNTSALISPTHAFSAAGSYTVTLTASGPGTSSSTISNDITVLDVSVTALSKADCRTNAGGSLSATVSGNTAPINYSWNTSPVQTTPVATGLAAGEYTVTISGTGICTTRGEGVVELDPACIGIWFPSAFTPDNNGKNDRFGPLGTLNMISNYRFEVYNRWGQLVFHSSDPYQKWDGKLSGESIPSFLFTWRAEFTLNGVKQSRRGTVVLIR